MLRATGREGLPDEDANHSVSYDLNNLQISIGLDTYGRDFGPMC